MNETPGDRGWITDMIMGVNDAALQWYATTTGRPIAQTEYPSMSSLLYGTRAPMLAPAAFSIGALVPILGVLAVVYLVVRR
jgi:hypothetical protein